MAHDDTIKLLRECNSGIQMAVYSIDEVLEKIKDERLRDILKEARERHNRIGDESHKLLCECGDDTKEPNAMAKGMSWIKTNTKLAIDGSDHVVADLITDGCNMGIKSLYRYLNQYTGADHSAKHLAEEIIRSEEDLRQALREYL